MSEYIKHYGVKGMKWGIRKDSKIIKKKKKHKNFVKNYYKANIKATKDAIKKIKNEGILKYYTDSIKDLKRFILVNSSLHNQHITNINNHIFMQQQQNIMNLDNINNQMTQISISQLNNAALDASHMHTMNFYAWQHMY